MLSLANRDATPHILRPIIELVLETPAPESSRSNWIRSRTKVVVKRRLVKVLLVVVVVSDSELFGDRD